MILGQYRVREHGFSECYFVDAIVAAITAVVGDIGVAAPIIAGGLQGAAVGAGLSAVEGGNVGLGALTGGITGGLIPAGGALAGEAGVSPVIGDVVGGLAGGAIGAGITGANPLTGALEGGAAGGLAALSAPTGEPTPALPGAEGTGVGGPISGTGEQTLSQAAIPQVASGEATTATAAGAGAPSTALGTLAGGPTQAVEGNAALAGFGGAAPESAALSTLSQAPGVSDFGAGTPGGAGAQLASAATPAGTDNVPIPDALNLPPITGPLSNVPGAPETGAGIGDLSTPNNLAGENPLNPGGTPPSTSEIGTDAGLSALATPSTGGGFATPSADALLASPGATTPGVDIARTGTGVGGGAGAGGGGIGGFIKDNPMLLAAAPLALTLLRGEGSLPPELKTLSGQVAGPAVATEQEQLRLANAGQPTPPQAAQIGLFVQQSNSALYQQLANQGVTNPQQDSRYIAGVQEINLQALAMTQNFIQQEFTNAFQAAGVASGALTAVANAQIANDNAFTTALAGAATSFGLLYAAGGGFKAAA